MSNGTVAADRDPVVVGALTELVRDAAYMICGEQPGVPRPNLLTDLDSFSSVQLMLELEKSTEVMLLEEVGYFRGETFGDMAEHVFVIAEQKNQLDALVDRLLRLAAEKKSPDRPTAAPGEAGSA
ncbi:hypothetical protein OH786_35765 (plasmid) [Streptomyces atratus]|uniref:Uncharacterized protein n=1 Tax=Streptomyces atratus TaxID=1893 RepID=A0A1K1ZU04_STRAR|nr:hypothetical protein [Streptomyces atratus]SFX77544.1 hypothetical protein SAMN02787144_100698 [Streptomyces atratus]